MQKTGLASQTTCGFSHNTRRDEQQDPGSQSFLRIPLGARCTMCDERHMELLRCEICLKCLCFECYRQEALEADYNNRNAEESESGSVGQTTAYPLAHQTQCSECDGGFLGNVLVRVLSRLHLLRTLGQWRTGYLGNIPTHPALSSISLSAQGGGVKGETGGETRHPPPCVEFHGRVQVVNVGGRVSEVVEEWWADTCR